MKFFLIIFISAVFLCNCSSASNENSGFNENYNPYTNTNNHENNADSAAKAVPYDNLKKSDTDKVFSRSANSRANQNTANPTALTQSLPENSEISTQMNDKGYVVETRTFKDHMVLKKIEKITITPKKTELKVYFKSGKIYDVPKDKIENFRTASAQDIYQAVGVIVSVKGQ